MCERARNYVGFFLHLDNIKLRLENHNTLGLQSRNKSQSSIHLLVSDQLVCRGRRIQNLLQLFLA